MSRHYFELRSQPLDQTTAIAADMMRHLHSRQYLGKVVVVCASPFSTMRVARKQWLKLARNIQRKRASTINADRILRLTYTITHMQHMQFVAKAPEQAPEAHVFFILPTQLHLLPLNCYTVYIAEPMSPSQLAPLIQQLPSGGLTVDYTPSLQAAAPELLPKSRLENNVTHKWQEVVEFFKKHQVNIGQLSKFQFTEVDALDNALDTLLGVSAEFLQLARSFQHTFELAQPFLVAHDIQQQYNTVTLLAYRVQALTPGVMSGYLLRTYHEDETYFLHDISTDLDCGNIIYYHQDAGRTNLARSLLATPQEWDSLDRTLFELQQKANIARYQMHKQPQYHYPNVLIQS